MVIDEIPRVPELLTVVHAVMETPSPPRFILTGSSARKLWRGGVDLLGGRAVQRTLHPFMAAELPAFDLKRALRFGLVPLVVGASDPAEVLARYASLYLEQEVRAEGLTRNIGSFTRFLEAVSFSHGAQVNVSAVARECEVERRVVTGSVGILEDLLPALRLPVFRKRAKRATVTHDKLYLFDAGVFRPLRAKGPLDRREEIDGQALEGLVAQHLRAWAAYSGEDAGLFFWRPRAGAEVDFVVYGETGVQAFEVKNAARVHSTDLRSLRAFRHDSPEAETAVLYCGHPRSPADRQRLVLAGRGIPGPDGPGTGAIARVVRRDTQLPTGDSNDPGARLGVADGRPTCPLTSAQLLHGRPWSDARPRTTDRTPSGGPSRDSYSRSYTCDRRGLHGRRTDASARFDAANRGPRVPRTLSAKLPNVNGQRRRIAGKRFHRLLRAVARKTHHRSRCGMP